MSARPTRALDALKAAGRLESTVVIVTGEHGEAFLANGVLGHGSRLDLEQPRVPPSMHVPGGGAGVLPGPAVHQDVLPTLLGALGAALPASGPTMGVDLRSGTPRRTPPVVGSCAISTPGGYAFLAQARSVLFRLAGGGATRVREIDGRGLVLERPPPEETVGWLKTHFGGWSAALRDSASP